MGAVMELIPRITALFIEGFEAHFDATREPIAKKFKGAVRPEHGYEPALVIGHPATLVVSPAALIPVQPYCWLSSCRVTSSCLWHRWSECSTSSHWYWLHHERNVVKTFIIGLAS